MIVRIYFTAYVQHAVPMRVALAAYATVYFHPHNYRAVRVLPFK